jgi:hypothetical protein
MSHPFKKKAVVQYQQKMDDIKKNDKQPLFPHQELVTKPGNELWMLWETKILASLTGNFPNQVGWMLNAGLDEKKPPWGLKMVPDFNQGYDDRQQRCSVADQRSRGYFYCGDTCTKPSS